MPVEEALITTRVRTASVSIARKAVVEVVVAKAAAVVVAAEAVVAVVPMIPLTIA